MSPGIDPDTFAAQFQQAVRRHHQPKGTLCCATHGDRLVVEPPEGESSGGMTMGCPTPECPVRVVLNQVGP